MSTLEGPSSGELPSAPKPEAPAPKTPDVKSPEAQPLGEPEKEIVERIEKDGDPESVLEDIAGTRDQEAILKQPTNGVESEEATKSSTGEETIEEVDQSKAEFSRLNENIIALVNIIEKNEGDVEKAKKILTDLLKARESLYLLVASAMNPDIRPVNGKDHIFQIGETQIFGSIIAVLDATPSLASHKVLADKMIAESNQGENQTLTGETLQPKKLVESAIVFSGSSAQDRIQPYGADIDMAEHIRIEADTRQAAAELLAKLLQRNIEQTIEVTDGRGNTITLHFTEMKAGGNFPSDAAETLQGQKLRWSVDEVKQGFKEYQTQDDRIARITLAQACQDPKMLKIDYIGVTPETVVEVTKVSTVQARNGQGNILIDNSTGQAPAFQEVYFGDPTRFGLIEETIDPDKFVAYVEAMKNEVQKYSQANGHLNRMKAAKRMYNLLKSQGDLALAEELSHVFTSDAATIYQLVDRLGMVQEAQKRGIPVEIQENQMVERLQGLLRESSNASRQEMLTLLKEGRSNLDLAEITRLGLQISNEEVGNFLDQHPNIKTRLEMLLTS